MKINGKKIVKAIIKNASNQNKSKRLIKKSPQRKGDPVIELGEMDRILAYNEAKQAGYKMYGDGSVWEKRLRDQGFTEKEIQEAKDIYQQNLRNATLGEDELFGYNDSTLGSVHTDGYLMSYLDPLEGAFERPEFNVQLSELNTILNALRSNRTQKEALDLLRTIAAHEVEGHVGSGQIYDFFKNAYRKDSPEFFGWAELNPTLAKLLEHNERILPKKFSKLTSEYSKQPEEIRARVVAVRSMIKDTLRKRYPDLERTNPREFDQKVNSIFNSMIDNGKAHSDFNMEQILMLYDPTEIKYYNEHFLKKGGII